MNIMRRSNNYSLILPILIFLFIETIATIMLRNHIVMGKLSTTRRSDVKTNGSVDKAHSKIFQFTFATFCFIAIGKFVLFA